jgi:hypothetical protein
MSARSPIKKKRLMKKLRAARDRKSAQRGRRIEGRKGYATTHPELVRIAKRLRHGNRKPRLSLRAISVELTKAGYVTTKGGAFSAATYTLASPDQL